MIKVGTSTDFFFNQYGPAEGTRRLAEAGFDAMDMGLFQMYEMAYRSESEREKALAALPGIYEGVAQACRETGIVVNQVHAPFPSYIGDPIRDPIILEMIRQSIAIAAQVGSRYIVVHPAWGPERIYDDAVEETFQLNLDLYSALIDDLKRYDLLCCVENMWCHDPDTHKIVPTVCSLAEEMCRMIDELNAIAGEKRFVACLDIGHANLTGGSPERMIRILGDRLEVLHVHDTKPNDDSHTAPFIGEINWDRTCAALKEIGYKGVFSFEADNWFTTFGPNLAMDSGRMLAAIGRDLAARCE